MISLNKRLHKFKYECFGLEPEEQKAKYECYQLIREYFCDNDEKIAAWWKTDNPMLGDTAPRIFIRVGRCRKLLKIIIGMLEESRALGHSSVGRAPSC